MPCFTAHPPIFFSEPFSRPTLREGREKGREGSTFRPILAQFSSRIFLCTKPSLFFFWLFPLPFWPSICVNQLSFHRDAFRVTWGLIFFFRQISSESQLLRWVRERASFGRPGRLLFFFLSRARARTRKRERDGADGRRDLIFFFECASGKELPTSEAIGDETKKETRREGEGRASPRSAARPSDARDGRRRDERRTTRAGTARRTRRRPANGTEETSLAASASRPSVSPPPFFSCCPSNGHGREGGMAETAMLCRCCCCSAAFRFLALVLCCGWCLRRSRMSAVHENALSFACSLVDGCPFVFFSLFQPLASVVGLLSANHWQLGCGLGGKRVSTWLVRLRARFSRCSRSGMARGLLVP